MVHRVHQPSRPLSLPATNIQPQAPCDPGVNTSATNNINVLHDTFDLEHPFPISSADRTAPGMMASIHGNFVLPLSDGSTCDIQMYYFPSLADTIISPQKIASPVIQDPCYNVYCLIDLPGCCRILLSHSHENDESFIELQKINDLYLIA
jgi:hypothetical protein